MKGFLFEINVVPSEVAELLLAEAGVEEGDEQRALRGVRRLEHLLDLFVGKYRWRLLENFSRLDLGCWVFSQALELDAPVKKGADHGYFAVQRDRRRDASCAEVAIF